MIKPFSFRFIQWTIVLISCLGGNAMAQPSPDSTRQTVTVKGTVDSSYRPRTGVLITARRSGQTTRTNASGKFELVIQPTDTLTFTYPKMPVRTYAFADLTSDVELAFELTTGEGQFVAIENNKGTTKPVDESALPSFPWPVPEPSAKYVLDDRYFATARTLAQVDQRLSTALRKSQYADLAYYLVPNGFALVSQLEQIESDGAPKADPSDRWSLKMQPLRKFDLANYLRLLVTSATGHFRVVVFLVTNATVRPGTQGVDLETARAWLNRGGNVLPDAVGKQAYGSDYHVTALIYEFQKSETGRVQSVNPSLHSGQTHLAKSNFIANLNR